jgi:hypothetical protein
MNDFIKLLILLFFSDVCMAESLKSIALRGAEIYLDKGNPHASSYYHDSKNFQLGSREGYPGVEAEILIEGTYKYMVDGEWVQEAVRDVVIYWGDGAVESKTPAHWPIVLKHKYGYDEDNFRVTISEPKEFTFEIRYKTDIGNEYTQVGKYNISLDQNGRGHYSKASREVEHYWYDSDCQMIDGLCYKGEVVTYETEKTSINIDLSMDDYFLADGVSSFDELYYKFKNIVCRDGYTQQGSECYKESVEYRQEVFVALVYAFDERSRIPVKHHFQDIKVGEVTNVIRYPGGACNGGHGSSAKGYYDESYGHYVVDASCAVRVEIVGCEKLDDVLVTGGGYGFCIRMVPVVSTVHDDFFEMCYPVVNGGGPSINAVADGYAISGTDFSCYENIKMIGVCYSPYSPYSNGSDLCAYYENNLEYHEGLTNDNNPKDTYKRD